MRRRWYLVIFAVLGVAALGALSYFFLKKTAPEGILEASGQVRGTEVTIS